MVVSLWAVPDQSTSELMTEFYKHLFNTAENPKRDKAVALRLAMLEMLEKHPNMSLREWAGFTLVGSAD